MKKLFVVIQPVDGLQTTAKINAFIIQV